MPTETIYFTDDQYDYLQQLVDDTDGINNPSQAVGYALNTCRQQDAIRGEGDG